MYYNVQRRKELTGRAVIMGIILSLVMTAANAYLALFAGMTVAAAIPAIVMAALIARRATIFEVNIIATGASAGESLAAGIAFTIPALLLTGVWTQFNYSVTTLVALCGGILGVLIMIPFRHTFISPPQGESSELKYPEGVAAAEVLNATVGKTSVGTLDIVWATIFGAAFKFFVHGLILIKGTVEGACRIGKSLLYGGIDTSMALLGVGYIIGFRVALMVFGGGFLAWVIAIPIYAMCHPNMEGTALDVAWTIWDTQIRYLGVGAMIVGGVSSIFKVRKKIWDALRQVAQGFQSQIDKIVPIHDQDMSGKQLATIAIPCVSLILALYLWQTPNVGIGIIAWVVMLIAAFFFVAVSIYIVGLVGSSNNPVSGMIITTLLLAGGIMSLFGLRGNEGILATLIVAGVVCCASATAGDIAQNLKTGAIIKGSPRAMQIIQLICVAIPALFLGPILMQLDKAYGIGTGLKAPQAKMFAALSEMIFNPAAAIPWTMIIIGVGIGITLLILDAFLNDVSYGKTRIYVMAVAVGIYLPLSLAVPMLLGGIIRFLRATKKDEVEGSDRGTLFASGLIAGEAIMAIILAVPIGMGWKGWEVTSSNFVSLIMLVIGIIFLRLRSRA